MNRLLFASILIFLIPGKAICGGSSGSTPPGQTISDIFSRIDYPDLNGSYEQPEPIFPVPEESFNELTDGLLYANTNGTPSWLSQTRDGKNVIVTPEPESYDYDTGTLNMNVGDMRIKLKSSSDDLLKQFKFDLDAVRRAQQAIKHP